MNQRPPYVLNALLDIDGIQLYTGLVKVGEKSNEITAIVPLLKVLDIENMIVTLDAIGTQRAVIRQILHQKGHYILPVKENRKGFLADLRDHFSLCSGYGKASLYSSEIEKEHGRLERRTVTLVPNDELGMGDEDLMSARFTALVHRERTIAKTGLYSEQDVFYISDCCSDPEVFSSIVRRHWKCEAAHWVLDMRFGEDRSTARTGFALENAALLRRIAFNLLQLECRETGIAPASFDTDLSSSRLEAILFKPLRLI